MNIDKKNLPMVGVAFLIVLVFLLVFNLLREGIFSDKTGLNLVVVGDNSVGILLLRPDEGLVDWIDLPGNLKVKIYNSIANYPVGSLWQYGVSVGRPFELIEKTLGLSMGVVTSRTIKVDGQASLENVLGNLHKLNLKTDLSFRDRWFIRQFLADTVAAKKVLGLTIPKNAFDAVVEPDGKEFLSFNEVANLWMKNKFVLEPILNENVDISVNNLTGQTGLGVQVSRQLESAGLRVVEVKADAADTVNGSGCLFMTKGSFPLTEAFLVQQLACVKKPGNLTGQNDPGIKLWLK